MAQLALDMWAAALAIHSGGCNLGNDVGKITGSIAAIPVTIAAGNWAATVC